MNDNRWHFLLFIFFLFLSCVRFLSNFLSDLPSTFFHQITVNCPRKRRFPWTMLLSYRSIVTQATFWSVIHWGWKDKQIQGPRHTLKICRYYDKNISLLWLLFTIGFYCPAKLNFWKMLVTLKYLFKSLLWPIDIHG